MQAWTSLRTKSLTFDELTYIPAGYSYVVTGDYRLNPEHPPLTKLLAGVAILPLRPDLDATGPAWQGADQWAFGADFFNGSGVDVERLVSAARLPTVFLLMLLVGAAYAFAADLYGRWAGLLAATLVAFDPNLLAHGRLATNDFALTFTMVLTVYGTFRFTRRPSAGSAALVGIALGLALLTKFIALLLIGLVPLWLAFAALRRQGALPVPDLVWLEAVSEDRAKRLAFAAGSAALMALIALFVVTLGYGRPGDPRPYLNGLGVLYTNVHLDMQTYLGGAFHEGRLWYYFPAAFLLKTPTPLLGLLALRAGDQITRRDVEPDTGAFLLLPAMCWVAVVAAIALPFGLRYVLPVYPLLIVYASGIVAPRQSWRPWTAVAAAACAVLLVAGSLRAHPHYIPYFNLLAGGPSNGIEWLDDSNIDWGQDLPLLRRYVEEHEITDLTVTPMAWYDPALYGVHGRVVGPNEMLRLLGDPDAPPGVYAVSAHLLTRGRYSPSSFDALSELEPTAILGHSIYVYER